jgi:hypothetical protein
MSSQGRVGSRVDKSPAFVMLGKPFSEKRTKLAIRRHGWDLRLERKFISGEFLQNNVTDWHMHRSSNYPDRVIEQ